jgi:hypothetical protein
MSLLAVVEDLLEGTFDDTSPLVRIVDSLSGCTA